MLQSPRLSSLSQAANSHWLPILYMVVYVPMLLSAFVPPSSSFPYPYPHVHKSVLYAGVSFAALQMGSSTVFFYIPCICVNIQCLFISFRLNITLYKRLQVHPLYYNWLKCVHFYGWIILHCIYVPQFIYPFIYWWIFRFFHVIDIVNSAALNIEINMTFSILVSSECWRIFILSSIVTVSIYIPNSTRGFPFLHTLSSTYCFYIFYDGHFWLVWGDISL